MYTTMWVMVASALASPIAVDPTARAERMLAGVAEEVASSPDEVRPAVARWLKAGGDLGSARDLLIAGGRRGCTGPCAPALLNAAGDVANTGHGAEASTSLVLDAVNDAVAWRLTTHHVVTDAELGYAVRAATARSLF